MTSALCLIGVGELVWRVQLSSRSARSRRKDQKYVTRITATVLPVLTLVVVLWVGYVYLIKSPERDERAAELQTEEQQLAEARVPEAVAADDLAIEKQLLELEKETPLPPAEGDSAASAAAADAAPPPPADVPTDSAGRPRELSNDATRGRAERAPAAPVDRATPPPTAAAPPAPATRTRDSRDAAAPADRASVATAEARRNAGAAERRSDGAVDLSGTWTLATHVRDASRNSFKGLQLGYRVSLTQDGDRITGHGEKRTENGRGISSKGRTPIRLEGSLNGRQLQLTFTEEGTRRTSGGVIVADLTEEGELRGTFQSDAAKSRGTLYARRAP